MTAIIATAAPSLGVRMAPEPFRPYNTFRYDATISAMNEDGEPYTYRSVSEGLLLQNGNSGPDSSGATHHDQILIICRASLDVLQYLEILGPVARCVLTSLENASVIPFWGDAVQRRILHSIINSLTKDLL